jgi:hypothetical protein
MNAKKAANDNRKDFSWSIRGRFLVTGTKLARAALETSLQSKGSFVACGSSG